MELVNSEVTYLKTVAEELNYHFAKSRFWGFYNGRRELNGVNTKLTEQDYMTNTED